MTTWQWLVLAYLAFGLGMTLATTSRGIGADLMFVVTWPIHLWLWLTGRDG